MSLQTSAKSLQSPFSPSNNTLPQPTGVMLFILPRQPIKWIAQTFSRESLKTFPTIFLCKYLQKNRRAALLLLAGDHSVQHCVHMMG
jgi:hypothetical protein